jgi:hypothetical protein
VGVEKLDPQNHAENLRARRPYERGSPTSYTFLVINFESIFGKSDFFNSHATYQQLVSQRVFVDGEPTARRGRNPPPPTRWPPE